MTEEFHGTSDHLIPEHPKLVEKRKTDKKTQTITSVAVNIQEFSGIRDYLQAHSFEEEEMVPPHVIVDRRVAEGKAAFSLCSGNGRTLKGRDLSEVRNSILKITGYLES
ncbi:hypothetical protein QVD17_33407 [Tagetes erecta]|uniref:Uncharacterized protein n=1 Tax=Tagetes erecta TaxID=13708 RepID=A0AAD8JWQ7_TARER|nr:hypothetical protein QVD17_33407 [Tagetes erecta]